MRDIDLIIIHCSAVKPSHRSSASDIDRWHKAQGWKHIGYHYVVRRDGTVETGCLLQEAGIHCKGHNSHSIGVCYEGGLDEQGRPADTRTERQKAVMAALVTMLRMAWPGALVRGHHSLNAAKACPCFDAEAEYF